MKQTLVKAEKIRFKSEFDQIRRNGRKLVGTKMLVVYTPAPDGTLRCGVVCGKKYSLLAVRRNRARRLCWESFRLLKGRMKVCHLLLIPRRKMENAKRSEVTRELEALLEKAGQLPICAAESLPEY